MITFKIWLYRKLENMCYWFGWVDYSNIGGKHFPTLKLQPLFDFFWHKKADCIDMKYGIGQLAEINPHLYLGYLSLWQVFKNWKYLK